MPRAYDITARAKGRRARIDRIVKAAYELFLRSTYDAVTLQAVADRAGVSLKTVTRNFESKDALVVACARFGGKSERALRAVEPGDVRAAVRVLADRYETTAEAIMRYIALEDRLPVVAEALDTARAGHLQWLEQTFAPYLPKRGAARERARAALFGATEIYVWWSWRKRLGYDRTVAESAMQETVEALVASWVNRPSR
jgi:AcrR family transcriptional regulator